MLLVTSKYIVARINYILVCLVIYTRIVLIVNNRYVLPFLLDLNYLFKYKGLVEQYATLYLASSGQNTIFENLLVFHVKYFLMHVYVYNVHA